jgi:hypothetical protein
MTMSDADLFSDPEPVIPDQDPRAFESGDLSLEELAQHVAGAFANVLERTGLVEVREMHHSVGQCHFLCRVKDKNKRQWRDLTKRMLVVMERVCDGFIGTQEIVLLKPGAPEGSTNPDDYDHRFGHLISIGAQDLKSAAEAVAQTIVEAGPTRYKEVTEAPMLGRGAPQSGGRATGRKGANLTSARDR